MRSQQVRADQPGIWVLRRSFRHGNGALGESNGITTAIGGHRCGAVTHENPERECIVFRAFNFFHLTIANIDARRTAERDDSIGRTCTSL